MASRGSFPIKILLLESGRAAGGSLNFLRDFIPRLDLRRIEPFVGFYSSNSSAPVNDIRRLGVPIIFFQDPPIPIRRQKTGVLPSGLKTVQYVRLLARIAAVHLPLALRIAHFVRKHHLDLIVFNQDIHYHLAGLIAAKLAGVPCVCRKAGGIGDSKRLKRIITPFVDVFVSISEATTNDQLNSPGTKRLIMIRRGINLEKFKSRAATEATRSELGLPAGQRVVATISRIEDGKGHMEFLAMAAAVLKNNSNVVFLVVGDQSVEGGTLVAQLKERVRQLKIDGSVSFAGWRDDVASVLSAVDIFVHCPTTFTEGLCVANLEAMAMGKPTVVSNNGGLPDAVVDGVTGFIVPPGDIGAMTDAVLRLLNDTSLCRTLGLEGRARVEQLFDMDQTARELGDVLIDCALAANAKHKTRVALKRSLQMTIEAPPYQPATEEMKG